MPNLENLKEQVAEIINSKDNETVRFTSLDMLYAYGQTELHPETAKHCNFQIIGGTAIGTYAFKTGFFGLTIMPPEFQKIMDEILHSVPNIFAFFDDILLVTKGNKEDHHLKKVEEVFRTLNEAGIRLKQENCKFAETSTEWLGFILSENGKLKKNFKQSQTS